MIAAQCYLIDTDHGIVKEQLMRQQDNSVQNIVIGNDVWLGANVTVLKGSKISDGAVIGAKSLVKGSIEPYSVQVGIPCRKIKYRE